MEILMPCTREKNGKYITGLLAVLFLSGYCLGGQPGSRGVPTPGQIAWHEMEIEMFLHWSPSTWQGQEGDDHSTPLDTINPTQVDTDQWCQVAKSFGAKQVIFVAKHTGGFCWWQTETTDNSIKKTAYKGGKGDILAEVAQSCRKNGLKLGIYLCPTDSQWGAGSGGRTNDPAKQETYDKILRQQWTEVLSKYGEISELWFDGSCIVELGDIIKKYAPNAMIFQSPQATLRWPGNEDGKAPYPTWQTVKLKDALTGVSTGRHSDPDGDCWLPMEMDTPLLDHKWFWAPNTDQMIKSCDTLMNIYYTSVGRGCVLVLNATPDTTGRIPESHVNRYKEFGQAIGRIYANKKGETSGTGRILEIHFDQPTSVNHIITMEDIKYGQIVRAYQVDGLINDQWQKLLDGISIGYKKIDVIETVQVKGLRLRITHAVDEPIIRSFAAYEVPGAEKLIKDQAAKDQRWHEIEAWKKVELTDQWQTLDIDLTPWIKKPGQYIVELRQSSGQGYPDMQKVVVVMDGTESPRLIEDILDQPCAWYISRTDQVVGNPKAQTLLRLTIRNKAGATGTGRLFIRSNF
jgi:alpha-L-fucosidase